MMMWLDWIVLEESKLLVFRSKPENVLLKNDLWLGWNARCLISYMNCFDLIAI